MRFHTGALRFLSILLILFAASLELRAETVRGKIVRETDNGEYPAAYAAVTLNSEQTGRSARTYSTLEGVFFLYNVPPGEYDLEVWAAKKIISKTPISVVPGQEVTDVGFVRIH